MAETNHSQIQPASNEVSGQNDIRTPAEIRAEETIRLNKIDNAFAKKINEDIKTSNDIHISFVTGGVITATTITNKAYTIRVSPSTAKKGYIASANYEYDSTKDEYVFSNIKYKPYPQLDKEESNQGNIEEETTPEKEQGENANTSAEVSAEEGVTTESSESNSINTGTPSTLSSAGTTTSSANTSSITTDKAERDNSLLDAAGSRLGKFRSYIHFNGNKRYYSSTDALIFLNGHKLDEIVAMNWSFQENKMPLWGYNSYTWDEVAIGTRSVQGTFVINFIIPDYLWEISAMAENTHDSDDNAIYTSDRNMVSDNMQPFQRWPQRFSIMANYGEPDKKRAIFLDDVYIMGSSQMLAEDGSPIYEQYSYIARDVRYLKSKLR